MGKCYRHGSATNNVRPTFMGVQLVNQSIIGSMFACPINNNLTYNFPGSPNGNQPMPGDDQRSYLYAFCFENQNKRSLVLINTDLTNSHTINFGGTNPPYGTVTVRQYAPSDLDEMNEAPTGIATNLTLATSAIDTYSLSSPSSIALPPFSVTALDYTAQGLAAAAMPTFSPAAGTYTTSQPVAIQDTTTGTTIYYTSDGSTPTTSSSVYSAPIMVSSEKTLQAIAVASGYATSPVASAAYTIAPILPTPTFNVAAGTYATTQSISLSDTQVSVTIYYTINGTTPTTSSSVYSAPISVGATETLEAIAVKTGYTNSATATVTYAIAPLPAVTFSPAPGTYTSAMAVSIIEPTAGARISAPPDVQDLAFVSPVRRQALAERVDDAEDHRGQGGLYEQHGCHGHVQHRPGAADANLLAWHWHLHDFAICDHQRYNGGRHHLLHNQRNDSDDIVVRVQRTCHSEPVRNSECYRS